MHKLTLLLFVLTAACGGSERDDEEQQLGSGGAGGDAAGIGGGPNPTTTTHLFECSRQGGAEWSVLVAFIQGDDLCAFLKVERPTAGGSVEDLGLAIDVPQGATLTTATAGRDAICDGEWSTWLVPASGTGSVAITETDAAGEPTEINVAVTLNFDDAAATAAVTVDETGSFVCGE
jgi:hypothetical protein